MVGQCQLTWFQTRQKLKEAYAAEFAAVIERAERQIILAKHGRRLLTLLDDTPVTPGDAPREYTHGSAARQILNDAEDDLRNWELRLDDEPETFHDTQPEIRDPTPESSIATGRGHGEQETRFNDSSLGVDGGEPSVAESSTVGVHN